MSRIAARSRLTSKPAAKQKGKRGEQAAKRQGEDVSSAAKASLLPGSRRAKLLLGVLGLAAGLWAYLPTSIDLIETWSREQDYSHGFIVIPIAALFLWLKRGSFPGLDASSPYTALLLLTASLAMRLVGSRYYLSSLDGWSIAPWVAAIVAMVGGRRLLFWCLPSIGFLLFMVPLPFRLENELSGPLQRVATKLSTVGLQLLGQPAFSDGNVILIDEDRLEVAQACSGLRLFMSTFALTYAYVAIIRRPLWEKALLALASVPIAIISNATRIIVTGLLYRVSESESLRLAAHNYAGLGMILLAAVLFWLVLWYMRKLFIEEEVVDLGSFVQDLAV